MKFPFELQTCLTSHFQAEQFLNCADLVLSYTQIPSHVWNLDTQDLKHGIKMLFPQYNMSHLDLYRCWHLPKGQWLTWSCAPSSLMWCCKSVSTGWPSLSQEMTGTGCPVASQWRTTLLLTTAPISSINSSDAPMITGGTKEVNTTVFILCHFEIHIF